MSIQTHFDNFNKTIYLTNQSGDYKKAKEKDESILDEIKAAFKDNGFSVKYSFLQGSFAIDTAIKNDTGDYDVDRSIVISASDAPEDPVKPKKTIKEVLEKRNFKDPRIKMPCVTADYKSFNLHIDYVVYAEDTRGNYQLAVGKEGSSNDIKEWSNADPKGLKEWILDRDKYGEKEIEKNKQFKRLVRYMKRWRDVTFSQQVSNKIFSIGLTVMIKDCYQPSFYGGVENDLKALKQVVDNMLSSNYFQIAAYDPIKYRVSVTLPRHSSRNIFNHKNNYGGKSSGSDMNVGTQLKNQLTNLQSDLQKALDESDEVKQCEILNNVFGKDFEIPKKSNNSSKAAASSTLFASAGAAGTSQGA